ncbi:MAG: hypothetical protein ACKO5E_06560 [bacterium]
MQEIAFRLSFPIPETTRFNRIRYQLLAETDPRFQPLIKRGLVYDKLLFESRPDGWSHLHRLNRFGFREYDFPIEKPVRKNRVIVVGDSITEGQGVASSNTIPAKLGKKLGSSTEVLNLGVVAATLDKVTLLAAESAEALTPQTVVMVMYANDLPAPPAFTIAALNNLETTGSKIRQDLDKARSLKFLPQIVRLGLRLSEDQPIYSRFFGSTIRYFSPQPDSTNPFSNQPNPNPKLNPDLEKAMRSGEINPWLLLQSEAIPGMLNADLALGGSPEPFLAAIGQICQRRKINLIIAYVPFYGTISDKYVSSLVACGMEKTTAESLFSDPSYSRHSTDLAAICKRVNIQFVDTSDALKKQEDSGKAQFWKYDSHPNEAGYETIAEAIFQAMSAK